MTDNNDKKLTHINGAPVADNTNSLTAGQRGPMMLQDTCLLAKMTHFARKVNQERRMHATGSGACTTYTRTNVITQFTQSKLLDNLCQKT